MAPNPNDSLKSTWRTGDRSKWNRHHWTIHSLNIYPQLLNVPVPVHAKTDKIPYGRQWDFQFWIIFHAMIPLGIHQAWLSLTSRPIHIWGIFGLYLVSFTLIGIREVHVIRRMGLVYGYFDGDVAPRDGVPDVGVARVGNGLMKTALWRMSMLVFLTYDRNNAPIDVLSSWQWWCGLMLKIGLYGLVVDFWFYWYHRAMHDIGPLWKYHRTHHLTKHPNPLLGAYADEEQEFCDMAFIPFLAYLTLRVIGLRLEFYEWWICFEYVAFSELIGHSGLRIAGGTPTTFFWLLDVLGMNLAIEDHDLHHRYGYRKSQNYGKQTRVWDRLFGTCGDRIEAIEENIDYDDRVFVPIF